MIPSASSWMVCGQPGDHLGSGGQDGWDGEDGSASLRSIPFLADVQSVFVGLACDGAIFMDICGPPLRARHGRP